MNPPPATVDASSAPLLQLRGVVCSRGDGALFAPVDLQLRPGDIVALVGANGIGKSTLLRGLAGGSPTIAGDVVWCDALAADRARGVLFSGHRSGLSAQLGAYENLLWYAALARGRPVPRVEIASALRDVGLAGYDDVPCGQLSAGQQRRGALARLLLGHARVWLLDEPLNALDEAGRALVERLLSAHAAAGGAALVATHAALACATASLRLVRDASE